MTEYYLRVDNKGASLGVWQFESDSAFRLDIMNPERSPGCYFKCEADENIWDYISRHTPWLEPESETKFHLTKLGPGECYPRMARPIAAHPSDTPGMNPFSSEEADFIALARGQFSALARQLDRICQTVHPAASTFNTYGHDIRNLLILACTEVEMHWRGILLKNNVDEKRFTTADYVRLSKAMKLDEFSVIFPDYPWIEACRPFLGWGSGGKPTQEIPWYEAYNSVKHNRETEFEQATLGNAFSAVSACLIMMVAQFGRHEVIGPGSSLRSMFHFSSFPSWTPSEVYIYPIEQSQRDWKPIPHPGLAS